MKFDADELVLGPLVEHELDERVERGVAARGVGDDEDAELVDRGGGAAGPGLGIGGELGVDEGLEGGGADVGSGVDAGGGDLALDGHGDVGDGADDVEAADILLGDGEALLLEE